MACLAILGLDGCSFYGYLLSDELSSHFAIYDLRTPRSCRRLCEVPAHT